MTTIIGVSLENRIEASVEFQRILTDYGCDIRTRLGLHPSKDNACSNKGIILLEVINNAEELKSELAKYWEVQTMVFD